jgi:hypothetical protein
MARWRMLAGDVRSPYHAVAFFTSSRRFPMRKSWQTIGSSLCGLVLSFSPVLAQEGDAKQNAIREKAAAISRELKELQAAGKTEEAKALAEKLEAMRREYRELFADRPLPLATRRTRTFERRSKMRSEKSRDARLKRLNFARRAR